MASAIRGRGTFRAFFALAISSFPALASADGRRDLEDGIAFYENLDSERALERLAAAARAADLGPRDRARAFLYLGMLEFENGRPDKAGDAWKNAFALEPSLPIPAGTSPKTIEAIETARARVRESPAGSMDPSDPEAPGTAPPPGEREAPAAALDPPSPAVDEAPDPSAKGAVDAPLSVPGAPLESGTRAASEDSSGGTLWLWTGVGGAAVAIAVVAIVLFTGGSQCKEAGGCLAVTFD